MVTSPDKNARGTTLNITVETVDAKGTRPDGERPQAVAYAFDAAGKLLNSAVIGEKGDASLALPPTPEGSAVRVLIGPRVDDKEISAAELKRRGALERRIDARAQGAIRFRLPPDLVLCWNLGICFVRGRLVKMLGPVRVPVCHATVRIYEVDIIPWILDLPVIDLDRFREEILRRWPWPPPPPEGPWGPIGPIPGPDPAPVTLPFALEAAGPNLAAAQLDLPAGPEAAQAVMTARMVSGEQFRAEILRAPELYKPWFCLIYPGKVKMDLVATATTDDCGEFSTWFWRGCNNPDQPDLYFKAWQHVPWLGNIQIYGPTPVSCHTRWNYKCGSEVTLVTTSPLARTCSPCPDEDVPNMGLTVKRIGFRLLNEVYGASDTLVANANNLGMVHQGGYDRPFGGLLHLQMNFSPALRANNVRYYRARIRRVGAADFEPLNLAVSRYYTVWTTPPTETSYPLGPQTVGATPNLYEIPTELGPVPNSTWSPREAFEEYHVKIPSATLAPGVPRASLTDNAGKFEVEIALFDGAGNQVNLAAAGVTFYLPTATDPAPVSGAPHIVDNTFRMVLHFDNNRCEAAIQQPQLDGISASPDCGILEWDDLNGLVTMEYAPYHRNGHGVYTFNVMRGASWLSLAAAAPSDALGVGGTVPPGGATYTNTQTVGRLLGGCPAAGFAAELYVDSLATDGTGAELGYDARALIAFALTPEME
jgi:hypothetical protein